jgi:hypothetical protein
MIWVLKSTHNESASIRNEEDLEIPPLHLHPERVERKCETKGKRTLNWDGNVQ